MMLYNNLKGGISYEKIYCRINNRRGSDNRCRNRNGSSKSKRHAGSRCGYVGILRGYLCRPRLSNLNEEAIKKHKSGKELSLPLFILLTLYFIPICLKGLLILILAEPIIALILDPVRQILLLDIMIREAVGIFVKLPLLLNLVAVAVLVL